MAEATTYDGSPNFLAWGALLVYPIVVLVLFARVRPHLAAVYSMLGAVMFLPEIISVDPPLLPPIDKQTLASFWVLIGAVWKARDRVISARPLRGVDGFFVLVLIGNLGCALGNGDVLISGPIVREGQTLYDAFAGTVKDSLFVYLPFFLARSMVRTREEALDVLRVLVGAALIYSFLAAYEIRMSPVLHHTLFGYHAGSFDMTWRGGGYRPTVFMTVGLAVAMFLLTGVIAGLTRWRAGVSLNERWGGKLAPAWITLVLLLCKSTGALVYALALLPVTSMTRRPRLLLPVGLAGLVFFFPLLRGLDLFPAKALADSFMVVSEDRASSLWFRFENEDMLLARARERIWFGWGGFSRSHVFSNETGEDLTITDGHWIIDFGQRGVIGFVGTFGLLLFPIFQAYRARNRVKNDTDLWLLAGLATIAAINAVDLLPNGLFAYLPYFYSGVLAGVIPSLANARATARMPAQRAQRKRSRSMQPAPV